MQVFLKLYCCLSFICVFHLNSFSQAVSYGVYFGAGLSYRSDVIKSSSKICTDCMGSPHRTFVNHILEVRPRKSAMLGALANYGKHTLSMELVRRGYEIEMFQDGDYYDSEFYNGPNTPNWNVIRHEHSYLQMSYRYKILDKKMMIQIGLSGSYMISRDGEISILYREMYENGEIVWSNRFVLNRRSNRIDFLDYGLSADVSLKTKSILTPFINGYFGLNDISKPLVATGLHGNLTSVHIGLKLIVRNADPKK